MERQFRRYFEVALRRRGVTGETLLQLLETRLDNVVYPSRLRQYPARCASVGRPRARGGQRHEGGHFLLQREGRRHRDGARQAEVEVSLAMRNLDLTQIVPVPDWLTVNRDAMSGTVARIPSREEIAPIVNEQLIVELYSR